MTDAKRNYKLHDLYANFSILGAVFLFIVTLYMTAKNPECIFFEWFHFAAGSAKLVTELITNKTVLREVKVASPLILQSALDKLKSEETQAQTISKMPDFVREKNDGSRQGQDCR